VFWRFFMNALRLYQSRLLAALLLLGLLTACAPAAAPQISEISISVTADGATQQLSVAAGSDVAAVLQAANIELGPLDRTEPELYAALADEASVRVIRVSEEFEVEQEPLPFESRTLKNEAMTPGDQRLIQNGVNGLEEITYRLLYEDGELVSRTATREVVITAPVEEIIMIGAESPFSSVTIPGRLAFLSAGNAWVLEQNTGARRPVVTSGDLDGRVFEISPDGEWLLFSRLSADETKINELWVASLDEGSDTQIDLGVGNVVHYAGWVPGSKTQVAFSTAEPSLNPPGWQANNDLQFVNFTAGGEVTVPRVGLPPNSDSLYSWWGSAFAWSPDGDQLAFARPDAVGLADIDTDKWNVLLPLITFQTSSDWAWMPGIAWSSDGTLSTVDHVQQTGLAVQERSPHFDLVSLDTNGKKTTIAANVGMFAAPVPEPDGGQVAFLRALTPSQSDISAYELMVVAPSGVMISLFPPQGAAGLQPQQVAWAPSAEQGPMVAFVYQGNLWVVNILSGEAQQLTGDGLVSRVSWH
jgi:Tol biopolymer transport system component